MTRTISMPGEISPSIDRDGIINFFQQRAKKVSVLGATQAVIYQDKNPELACQRDAIEKALLHPMIDIKPTDRVLDVGCGTGRWAELLVPDCAIYHGVDISPELIEVARNRFSGVHHAHFSVCSLDELSSNDLGAEDEFTKIVSFGVFIYLNDNDLRCALERMADLAAAQCRIVLREPVGLNYRLTLSDHFSDDMEQFYSAIYRTESELLDLFSETLGAVGFKMVNSGDVYRDVSLNNRAETKQRFFLFSR